MPFGQNGFFGGIADFLTAGVAAGQALNILPQFGGALSTVPQFPQIPNPQTAGGISLQIGSGVATSAGVETATRPTAVGTGAVVAFRQPANGCPARPLPTVRVVNPDTGRETYYRHVGAPVRFSKDKGIIKKLSKDARQIVAVCSRPR